MNRMNHIIPTGAMSQPSILHKSAEKAKTLNHDMRLDLSGEDLDVLTVELAFRDMFAKDFETANLGSLHTEIMSRSNLSNLFNTAKGHLGVCFRTVDEGDDIVLFKGCDHPMVVQKSGDFCLLEGRARIPGLVEPYLDTNNDLSLMKEILLIRNGALQKVAKRGGDDCGVLRIVERSVESLAF